MDVYILSRRNLRYKKLKEGATFYCSPVHWDTRFGDEMEGWEYYYQVQVHTQQLSIDTNFPPCRLHPFE